MTNDQINDRLDAAFAAKYGKPGKKPAKNEKAEKKPKGSGKKMKPQG